MKNSFQRYFRFIAGVVVVMLLIILFSSYHASAAVYPGLTITNGSSLEKDAIVASWGESSAGYVGRLDVIPVLSVPLDQFKPFAVNWDGLSSWYVGCGDADVYGVLYEVCIYDSGKIYRYYSLDFACEPRNPVLALVGSQYYLGGYMGLAPRRYSQFYHIPMAEPSITTRTTSSYSDYKPYANESRIMGVYRLDPDGQDTLFNSFFPYGEDPPPLTGDILYPQGYRGWDYLRNFGAEALPSYEDLQRFLYYFSNSPSANDTVVNYFYLVLRSKTTSKYQVHILGRDIYEEYSQQAGILLKWKKARLFGLLGGYYQANNNPSIPTTGVVNPGRSQWIGPGRSCWFLEVSRFGSVYPYKVNNKFDVVEFGCFVPDHQQQLPPVLNPPESLPPEYDPEAQIEPPQALSAIEEALIALFVPRSFAELDVMDMLGDVTEPVSSFLGIFKDVAEFDPQTNAPDVFYNGVNVLSPLAEIMGTPVTLFGYNGSLISVVRKLNTVNLGLIMAYSFYRLGRRVFGGGGAE